MPRLAPEEVENILRWYLMDGGTSSSWEVMGPADPNGGPSSPWTYHTTIGMKIAGCDYKVPVIISHRLQHLPPVYLAVRAELEYEKAGRQFDQAGRQGAGMVFVRHCGRVVTYLELLRITMDGWWREQVYYREHGLFGKSVEWMAEHLWIAGQEDQSFLPAVMGGP